MAADRLPSHAFVIKRYAARRLHLGILLILHGPGNRVTVVFKLDLTCTSESDPTFAAVIVCQEFVGGSEVARLALAVVVVAGEQDLVPKVQDLAPAAFEVFRCAGVRESQGFHRFVDRHLFVPLKSLCKSS